MEQIKSKAQVILRFFYNKLFKTLVLLLKNPTLLLTKQSNSEEVIKPFHLFISVTGILALVTYFVKNIDSDPLVDLSLPTRIVEYQKQWEEFSQNFLALRLIITLGISLFIITYLFNWKKGWKENFYFILYVASLMSIYAILFHLAHYLFHLYDADFTIAFLIGIGIIQILIIAIVEFTYGNIWSFIPRLLVMIGWLVWMILNSSVIYVRILENGDLNESNIFGLFFGAWILPAMIASFMRYTAVNFWLSLAKAISITILSLSLAATIAPRFDYVFKRLVYSDKFIFALDPDQNLQGFEEKAFVEHRSYEKEIDVSESQSIIITENGSGLYMINKSGQSNHVYNVIQIPTDTELLCEYFLNDIESKYFVLIQKERYSIDRSIRLITLMDQEFNVVLTDTVNVAQQQLAGAFVYEKGKYGMITEDSVGNSHLSIFAFDTRGKKLITETKVELKIGDWFIEEVIFVKGDSLWLSAYRSIEKQINKLGVLAYNLNSDSLEKSIIYYERENQFYPFTYFVKMDQDKILTYYSIANEINYVSQIALIDCPNVTIDYSTSVSFESDKTILSDLSLSSNKIYFVGTSEAIFNTRVAANGEYSLGIVGYIDILKDQIKSKHIEGETSLLSFNSVQLNAINLRLSAQIESTFPFGKDGLAYYEIPLSFIDK